MEQTVVSALSALLASALWDILTDILKDQAHAAVNAAWRAFMDFLKRGGEPVDDLRRAVRRSFILALKSICDHCIDELKTKKKEHAKEIAWLEQKRRRLDDELKAVEGAGYGPLESLTEIELLVLPDGSLAQERIDEIKRKLVDAAIAGSEPPACFREKVENELFRRMGVYFAEEIKTDEIVKNVFEGQLLSQINVRLQAQELKLDRIIEFLLSMITPSVPDHPIFLYRRKILEQLYNFYIDYGPNNYVYADELVSWRSARSAGDDEVWITAMHQLIAEGFVLALAPRGGRVVVAINPEKAQEIQRIVLLGR